MKDKFYAMQTLLEERTKEKAREVVELQGQVQVLEDEVEQLERRRGLRLEEGETIVQRCGLTSCTAPFYVVCSLASNL